VTDTIQKFDSYFKEHPESSFAEWLRVSNKDRWNTMLNHRFIREMETDTILNTVFERYLHNEHAFVRSAIQIFAYALAKTAMVDDQNRIVKVVYALATEQDQYFHKTYQAMGLAHNSKESMPLEGKALLLSEGAIGIAESCTFLEILSTMLAAEWMYLTWCAAAASGKATGVKKAWIDLHVGNGFRDQIAWMTRRVNELGMVAPTDIQDVCSRHFGNMLDWEIAFHDAPYEKT